MAALQATLNIFYADLPKGTKGAVMKSWTDNHGNRWHRLLLGSNLSGQKLKRTVPENCLTLSDDDNANTA